MTPFDLTPVPGGDHSWLNPGDTAWQLTSATLVGLMSVPGLAVLYAGLMKRKWALNSALMVLYAFAMTLVVWTLIGYNLSFGAPWFFDKFPLIGKPGTTLSHENLLNQAGIPLLTTPSMHFPGSTMVYFQFVFAAITIILLAGALLGRMNFKAWMLFVPLWIIFVYSFAGFGLWGGGWMATMGNYLPFLNDSGAGAVDWSGGYVIHVAAGISGVVGAAVIGPRLQRDRDVNNPSDLLMAIVGGGLLWLGWNGFNGGDPFFANPSASAAVLNTNLCAATARLVWLFLDVFTSGRGNVAGMINGMIAGLVAITPAAGFVNGYSTLLIGVLAGSIPWATMSYVSKIKFFARIDDTLGIMHTHLFAGALGGLMVGLLASPSMVVYFSNDGGKTAAIAVTGLFYGHWQQLVYQILSLLAILIYDGIATFILMKLVGLVVPLRMPADHLEIGDEMVHGDVSLDLGHPRGDALPASVPITHTADTEV